MVKFILKMWAVLIVFMLLYTGGVNMGEASRAIKEYGLTPEALCTVPAKVVYSALGSSNVEVVSLEFSVGEEVYHASPSQTAGVLYPFGVPDVVTYVRGMPEVNWASSGPFAQRTTGLVCWGIGGLLLVLGFLFAPDIVEYSESHRVKKGKRKG